LPAKVAAAGIKSPALIIVGTVVRLQQKLAWFHPQATATQG
jgi:siroheme synthase